MRVRTTTGLHGADLYGPRQVADIENSQAAKTLVADVLIDTLQSAVHATAGLFDRCDQEVANDRDISLTSRTND